MPISKDGFELYSTHAEKYGSDKCLKVHKYKGA